jgi:hypothetical protein
MGVLDVQPAAHATRTLATAYYCPASEVGKTTTTTSDADVDATNAAVTFTAPASGTVWITAKFMVITGVNTAMDVTLRTGSSTVANTKTRVAYVGGGSATIQMRVAVDWKLTGLTPGASSTYKLGFARATGTDTCDIHIGTLGGPLSMIVEDRP